MRYLVVAPQPFFTPRGTPFSVYYRALIMSELGVKIDLLTYGEGKDVDIPNLRIVRGPRLKWLGNVKAGPSTLKLFLNIFTFFQTVYLLIRHRYEVVHAHEEAVFFCRFLKPIFRFKLIYDMHSSLKQQLRNFGYTESKLIHFIFEKLEISSINTADAVITICPDLAEYVETIISDSNKHLLIENSVFDPVKLVIDQRDPCEQRAEINPILIPSGRFCFVYAGTLETYQGIDILVRAFRIALEKNPKSFMIIVGGSPEQVTKYKSLVEEEGLLEDISFTGRVSQQLAHLYMRLADALLSPRTEGTNTPLKIYQLLASGIPIVATNIHSHTQVLNDNVAFLADPEPSSFADAMLAVAAEPSESAKKVECAMQLYQTEYARESYIRKLESLLESIR